MRRGRAGLKADPWSAEIRVKVGMDSANVNVSVDALAPLPAELQQRLERCTTLPSVPAIAVRVLQLCQSEDLDLRQVAEVLGRDPALTAKVLRMVNSPALGLRQTVSTLPHAIALLGLNSVRTLALSFSLVRDLRKGRDSGLERYWKRSLASAVAARELAVALRFPAPDEAFLAALLQDIGVLAMGRVLGGDYGVVAERASDDHARLGEIERSAFGTDHAAVGAWLLTSWNFPLPLRRAVGASHQAPSSAPPQARDDIDRLMKIVRMSGALADIWVRDDAALALKLAQEAARSVLGWNEAMLEPVLARTAAAIPAVAELFDLKLGSSDEIASILEQATETLVNVTLRASRQADMARVAIDDLKERSRVIEEASQRDKLTGLYNRARFDEYLNEQFAQVQRTGKPLSVIMVDVDHFKQVNDTHGHPAGDRILIAVSGSLGGRLRPRDLTARYGGEEFVLILPETDAAGAKVVAERTRQKVEGLATDAGVKEPVRVTISLGCATFGPASYANARELLGAADRALYAAKRGGRNRVEAAGPLQEAAPDLVNAAG